MPTKPPAGGTGQQPDVTAYYEAAGTEVLTAYAREEMSGSVARLKRGLRTAFSEPKTAPPRAEQRRQS
jgi:hypothetical protein